MAKSFAFEGTQLHLVLDQYHDGALAVSLADETGAPFARLSVNVFESATLPEGVFFLKGYSENATIADHMVEQGILVHSQEIGPVTAGFTYVYAMEIDPAYL